MNFPNRPCLITMGLPQFPHVSSVASSSGRWFFPASRVYLQSGYAEHAKNLPKRPRRSRIAFPHSGQASPVSAPAFWLTISFLAFLRSFSKGP